VSDAWNPAHTVSPEPPATGGTRSRNAFRHRSFRLFWTSRFLANFAAQIVSVSVGWQIYALTHSAFNLGLVGLVQFAPALVLVLYAGHVADRFNRRAIMAVCQGVEALVAGAFVLLTVTGLITAGWIFALLFVFGIARAFMNPASSSLVPNLVPPEDFAGAVALSSTSWQVANIVGPAVGGILYGFGPTVAYGVAFAMFIAAGITITMVPKPPQKALADPRSLSTMLAGFRYIWREKVVLGAISLDLFAVLLGGATALLPAYVHDIIQVGPWGLGLLRSAMGIGGILVAAFLTLRPIEDHAGVKMFTAVAFFGAFIVLFGISTTLWLSVIALMFAGAADMVSVYVRETLLQLWTPDDVRGRVNAVNNVFIGASNELGEFRAGTMAALIGVVPAVVVGGIGTLAVAGLWAWLFPDIRRVRHLRSRDQG
jgi:MFS family permease